tara:strand:+ start:524 stop:949 length:426 start_codon:yes stop_codon:yes gene_type:complete
MLKWFRNRFKKKEKKSAIETGLKDKTVASMRYLVDEEGTVYIDFFWDNNLYPNANEAFSVLFSQINAGDLLEESVKFIGDTLTEKGEEEEFTQFFSNLMEIQHSKIKPLLDMLNTNSEKAEDKVVVKPTDIASHVFRGNQT